jgi:hypothetical protein
MFWRNAMKWRGQIMQILNVSEIAPVVIDVNDVKGTEFL